jgi:hypothetical protein
MGETATGVVEPPEVGGAIELEDDPPPPPPPQAATHTAAARPTLHVRHD